MVGIDREDDWGWLGDISSKPGDWIIDESNRLWTLGTTATDRDTGGGEVLLMGAHKGGQPTQVYVPWFWFSHGGLTCHGR
jgi:hypothetical protein